jgi:RimJ/RimL family protein N-acetyltransferase
MTVGRATKFSGEAQSADFPSQTTRLNFIPMTRFLADAESSGNGHFADSLAADVPQSWPPESVAPPGDDNSAEWENCYLTHFGLGVRPVLVGIAGIKRWSPEHKTLQVGTALIPEFHGKRLGEEITAALGKWGLSQQGIDRVICDIPEDHQASAKSLARAGYSKATKSPSPGFVRFVLTR